MRVDHRLHIDPPDTLDRPDEVRILTEKVAGVRRLHVLLGIDEPTTVALNQANLCLGQHASRRRGLLLEPQEPLEAKREPVPLPYVTNGGEGETPTPTSRSCWLTKA